ncbi:uncharacterized protein MONBRDRAFT_34467 [Monosiga brevicollis MX1]|uniref:Uncharacterized protein n=1 Tax=Monosiga brevicollis TaxID=81824 RepID=A9VBY2_MONBE|nr:uncharacterized protein MONBRDRAFT_34467 [Monosiga brevicollis MX1]EDQ84929.1 predicted protein [Monosiga brevicollis MX1]|eukprot:XP_001750270.1 hypothetical protein [Monosiga brevicollis MX1]
MGGLTNRHPTPARARLWLLALATLTLGACGNHVYIGGQCGDTASPDEAIVSVSENECVFSMGYYSTFSCLPNGEVGVRFFSDSLCHSELENEGTHHASSENNCLFETFPISCTAQHPANVRALMQLHSDEHCDAGAFVVALALRDSCEASLTFASSMYKTSVGMLCSNNACRTHLTRQLAHNRITATCQPNGGATIRFYSDDCSELLLEESVRANECFTSAHDLEEGAMHTLGVMAMKQIASFSFDCLHTSGSKLGVEKSTGTGTTSAPSLWLALAMISLLVLNA